MQVTVRAWTPQDNYERWDYLLATARYAILVPHNSKSFARRGGIRSEHNRPVLILADGSDPIEVHLRHSALKHLGVDIPVLVRALEDIDLRASESEQGDAVSRSRAAAHLIGNAVDECLG